jgi:poly-gamma-glutamate synthesis protein (capsule biosynthesis protein)
MSPANLDCLIAAHPDAVVLANNHVLDFGLPGLADTLDALARVGLADTGAGLDRHGAWRPVAVPVSTGRVFVAGMAAESSGVPGSWAASADRPGVAWLPDLDPATADAVAGRVNRGRRPGDLAVVSLHWGSNWGFEVAAAQVAFAHRLVDAGIDVVHGHSSHHPRPIEVYRGKLILYGCGDLINDYEGIGGYADYRPDLRVAYLADLDPDTGDLIGARLLPTQARRMRLQSASHEDSRWLGATLDRLSTGCTVQVDRDGQVVVKP